MRMILSCFKIPQDAVYMRILGYLLSKNVQQYSEITT